LFYQSISLTTTASEVRTLTAGNDTVDGATVVDSLSGDTIVDSTATDTDVLNAILTTSPTKSTITSVETVNLTGRFGAVTFDASGVSNGTIVAKGEMGGSIVIDKLDGSTGAKVVSQQTAQTVTNIQKNGSVEVAATTTTVVLDADTAAAASNQTATLKLVGNTITSLGDNGGDGFTALTINSTGAANKVTVDGTNNILAAATSKITATGDKDLTVTIKDAQFTGGTFVDSTTAGTTTVKISGATMATTLDISKMAADVVEINAIANTSRTAVTFASGQNIKVTAANSVATDDLTFAAGATGATLNLTLSADADQSDGLTAKTNITTVNLATAAAAATGSTDTELVLTAGANNAIDFGTNTVLVSGATNIKFADANSTATIKANAIDASALTGKLAYEFSGDTGNVVTVTGGSGNDTFTFNAADDATIDGKGGSNTVALAAAVDLTSNVVSFANIQTLQLDSGNANVLAASQVTGLTLTAFGGDFKVTQTDGTSVNLSGMTGDATKTVTIDVAAGVQSVNQTIVGAKGLINTIDLSAGLSGTAKANITGGDKADTLKGFDNADTISGGVGKDSITGGKGNDVLTGGDNSDTFVFASSGANNGKDTITDFTVGVDGDVLDVAGFDAGFTVSALTSTTATGATQGADNAIYVVNFGGAIASKVFGGASAANFADLFAASGKFMSTTTGGDNQFVLVVQGTDQTQILFVDSGDTAVADTEVSVVGILSNVTSAATFDISNFA